MVADRVRLTLVSGLGCGLLPKAPGTWASAVAAAAWWAAFGRCGRPADALAFWLTAAAVLGASAGCVLLAPWAERHAGKPDPKFVVLDEWAGQWAALLLAAVVAGPTAAGPWRMAAMTAVAFALFRVFDIAKPWPCRALEKLPRGWGVLADDLAAGLYAAAATSLLTLAAVWVF